jgi:pimeloyl-ACP methyl ester carboxylesterase
MRWLGADFARFMIPIFVLQTWLLGLFSLGVIGGALYLAHQWQQRSWGWDSVASPAGMARGMLGMMRYDANQTLARISVPTLVVADSVTKPETSERIRSGIFAARLITLAPAKHLGVIEHHTKYAAVVREFAYAAEAQMGDVA